jgi:hypothetical protein
MTDIDYEEYEEDMDDDVDAVRCAFCEHSLSAVQYPERHAPKTRPTLSSAFSLRYCAIFGL